MKSQCKPATFSIPVNLSEAIKLYSFDQSHKSGKRVTASAVVVDALLQYGIKPVKAKRVRQ